MTRALVPLQAGLDTPKVPGDEMGGHSSRKRAMRRMTIRKSFVRVLAKFGYSGFSEVGVHLRELGVARLNPTSLCHRPTDVRKTT